MCNRVLLLFGKMLQWNLYVNCHVNGTSFQSGLRFQTGWSSLRVSCKRADTSYLHKFLKLHISQTKKISDSRRSHRSCSIAKAVAKKFLNIHRKTTVLGSLFNRVAGLKACNFIKRKCDTATQGFFVFFCEYCTC